MQICDVTLTFFKIFRYLHWSQRSEWNECCEQNIFRHFIFKSTDIKQIPRLGHCWSLQTMSDWVASPSNWSWYLALFLDWRLKDRGTITTVLPYKMPSAPEQELNSEVTFVCLRFLVFVDFSSIWRRFGVDFDFDFDVDFRFCDYSITPIWRRFGVDF